MGFALTAGLGCIVASKSTHCAQERPYGHGVRSTILFTNYPMRQRSSTQMLTSNFNLTTQKGFRDTRFEALCRGVSLFAPQGIQAFDLSANRCCDSVYRKTQASATFFAELKIFR